MKLKTLPIIFFVFSFFLCSNDDDKFLSDLPDGLYALIKTEIGTIVMILYHRDAPLTVKNFVGLATGNFSQSIERKGKYFDGLVFHRVVPGFVIQGGDPLGNGTGGPGYAFADELNPSLSFSSKGILAMANSGPSTNGSQFFITLDATPWLDQKHTIFGKVVKNFDTVTSITQGTSMQAVRIKAKGDEASRFIKESGWEHFSALRKEKQKEHTAAIEKNRERIEARIQQEIPALEKTTEGIYTRVISKGSGPVPRKGQTVLVHYVLRIFGKTEVIDSSRKRDEPFRVIVGNSPLIKGWEIVLLQMKKSEKRRVVIPPELAYGAKGLGAAVPPHSFLDFEMELVSIQ